MNVLFYRKTIVAVTGLFLCIFLIVHLSANAILVFPEELARAWYNSYSTTLRESPLIKIVAYLLYLSIVLHALYALLITIRNRKAKPHKYVMDQSSENSTWASKNMGILGTLILIFIMFSFKAKDWLGYDELFYMDNLKKYLKEKP